MNAKQTAHHLLKAYQFPNAKTTWESERNPIRIQIKT